MYRIVLFFIIVFLISCSENQSNRNNNSQIDYKSEYANTIKKYDNTYNEETKEITNRFMYVNGFRMARNMQRDSIKFDIEAFIQGFVDGLKNENLKISIDSMDAVVVEWGKYIGEKKEILNKNKEIRASVEQVKNLSEADSFLVANKEKKDVITLPSNLQYKVIKEGNGPMPSAKDYVLVHITSSFVDGTIFDDTRKSEPRVIPNEKMIAGWLEGITKMKVGSRWILYMHPTLGFGEFGIENKIPPNKFVIMDVELIKILTQAEFEEYIKKRPPTPMIPDGPVKGF